MFEPVVTVTMPCRDCADTVGRAMESILAQSLRAIEVVAVDDGSEDNTGAVLDEFARRDDRVRVVHAAHGGVAVAANTAMGLARGRYIARMDADDEMLPERLAAQARLLDEHPEIGLAGSRIRFGGDRHRCAGYARYVDWTNTLLTHEAISLNRFVEFPVPNPSIMCRRACVETHGPYRDGDFPEDYELLLRWLEAGVRMAKVDAELLVWNDPPDRLSRTHPRYRADAFYRVKAQYLARWLASYNRNHPEVHILGSGRTTRKRADMLLEHGVRFAAYYDVDPRKIGHVIGGIEVRPREAVPPPGEAFCLPYVASRGAREDIADFLDGRGFVLGRDYLPVA
ncbi:MAG: glycosyltransferase [Pseudodesulfovibrio sp.]|uniref:Glycosyl transferase family 2 n=1 Tax=Pseudodesulfovibrio aespoeensis (strain ATCC 700646 / DSM 10631 / Aspo-2) TaxID=643562 RepID=E6VUE1_PSEA9|nr:MULTISPECIES: glycosyltransferase family 2 protein [Pseudodesulfovibrio]MBU4190963.1 glycosyltransferase [Pseudomonadota bacterium]MCG2733824.1 glycosyltransferase [Pseudodesulfovibrio aespoeensis]ADU63448.1 glycosyl transferase family 2 [Pseudodesulfovibrio aespoeensis Aspo-2]MBU4243495.1 glycosyltransferase [Pseudomonadota bacterium]MBU4377642.1 glycosyltransferase [Pseudomonadota bacterium]